MSETFTRRIRDHVIVLPCSAGLDQVGLLADAVSDSFKTPQDPFGTTDT
jgi:hypothetical protein